MVIDVERDLDVAMTVWICAEGPSPSIMGGGLFVGHVCLQGDDR
jgi:hypothetical protein